MPSPARFCSRFFKWALLASASVALGLLLLGDRLLIATDPMPAHADAAVVLQGSIIAQKVRIAGAMDLLRRGIADRVLVSVPKESYWGQSLPPVARSYLERTYGNDLAARVDFCEASADVDSTAQEAEAAMHCIAEHRWRTILVVTSEYHTRRARILWRRAWRRNMNQSDPAMQLSIESVADPEFPRPWWRHRRSAKIWLGESLKLISTFFGA
jgi:DUF218 domain